LDQGGLGYVLGRLGGVNGAIWGLERVVVTLGRPLSLPFSSSLAFVVFLELIGVGAFV
jgi:hypothetical protein